MGSNGLERLGHLRGAKNRPLSEGFLSEQNWRRWVQIEIALILAYFALNPTYCLVPPSSYRPNELGTGIVDGIHQPYPAKGHRLAFREE